MGACLFQEPYYGPADAATAYRSLVDEWLFECGHDPYNGTISTTDGVSVVSDKPMSLAEAKKYITGRLDGLSKGACEAVALQQPQEWVSDDEPHRVSLSVPFDTYMSKQAMQVAMGKALDVAPERVEDWHDPGFGNNPDTFKVNSTVKAVAPKAQRETRYFVLRNRFECPRWERGYPTQAAARAAAQKVSNGSCLPERGSRSVTVEIVSMTRRSGGVPLVEVTYTPKSVDVTLEVTLRTKTGPVPDPTVRRGWLFYGMAAT